MESLNMIKVFAGKVRKTGFFQKAGFPGAKITFRLNIRIEASSDTTEARFPPSFLRQREFKVWGPDQVPVPVHRTNDWQSL
jgi:hypothetical protein